MAETQAQPQTFRIVLVSDVHKQGRRLDQITKWLLDRNDNRAKSSDYTAPTEWINAVLCMGDISDMPPGCQDPYITAAELGACSSNFVLMTNIASKLIYVPGNHDPVQMYASGNGEPPILSVTSLNAHRRWVRIVPGIVVCGIGGSGPAKMGSDEHPFFSFPYKSERDFEEQVAALNFDAPYSPADTTTTTNSDGGHEDIPPEFITKNFVNGKDRNVFNTGVIPVTEVGPEDSVILMTHEGPAGSPTTVDFDHDGTGVILSCGSEAIAKLIRENQGTDDDDGEEEGVKRHIVAAVHGHSHNSAGMSSIGNVKVINPGALCDGNFALLTLAKNPGDTLWHVSDCVFAHLPDLLPLTQIKTSMALNN